MNTDQIAAEARKAATICADNVHRVTGMPTSEELYFKAIQAAIEKAYALGRNDEMDIWRSADKQSRAAHAGDQDMRT